jgi:hypothetical protein
MDALLLATPENNAAAAAHRAELVAMAATVEANPQAWDGSRIKILVCTGIPLWNLVAPIWGLPAIPVPAFCSTT